MTMTATPRRKSTAPTKVSAAAVRRALSASGLTPAQMMTTVDIASTWQLPRSSTYTLASTLLGRADDTVSNASSPPLRMWRASNVVAGLLEAGYTIDADGTLTAPTKTGGRHRVQTGQVDFLPISDDQVAAVLSAIGRSGTEGMMVGDIAKTWPFAEGTLNTIAATVLGEPDNRFGTRREWTAETVVRQLLAYGYITEAGEMMPTNLADRMAAPRSFVDPASGERVRLLTLAGCAERLGVAENTVSRWPTPTCADMQPAWIQPYVVERRIPLYREDEVVEFGKLPAGRWGKPRLDADGRPTSER